MQYNLFGAFARKVEETSDKDLSTKRYFVCREVEDNYTKYSSTKNSSGTVLYCWSVAYTDAKDKGLCIKDGSDFIAHICYNILDERLCKWRHLFHYRVDFETKVLQHWSDWLYLSGHTKSWWLGTCLFNKSFILW